jgi:hypothetical protein
MRNGPQIQHEEIMETIEYAARMALDVLEEIGAYKEPGGLAAIESLRRALATPVDDGRSLYIRADHLRHAAGWNNALCELSTEPRSDRVRIYTHPAPISPATTLIESHLNHTAAFLRKTAVPVPVPDAWLMDSGDDASWVEIGPKQPAPEAGFVAVPLYR